MMIPGKKRGMPILPVRSLHGGIFQNGGLRGVSRQGALRPGRVQRVAILREEYPRNGIRRQATDCRKEVLTGVREAPRHKGSRANLHGHPPARGPRPQTPLPGITKPRNLPLQGRDGDFSASGKGDNSSAMPLCGDDTLQKHLLTLVWVMKVIDVKDSEPQHRAMP